MKKTSIINYIPLSGLALGIAWPPSNFYSSLLLFVAFLPILHLMFEARERKYSYAKVFKSCFYNFFIFTILSIYWLFFAGQELGLLASVGLLLGVSVPVATFMSIAVVVALKISAGFKSRFITHTTFVCVWLAYEYLSFNWQLHFPWLTLGNALAPHIHLIQWYEYTGVFGGSLWILVLNSLLYELIFNTGQAKHKILLSLSFGALIIGPVKLSQHLYDHWSVKERTLSSVKVGLVQPNINPFTEKFNKNLVERNFRRTMELSQRLMQEDLELLVWPETTIAAPIDEENIYGNWQIKLIKDSLLTAHPRTMLLVGAITRDERSHFNAALAMGSKGRKIEIYHKNKLVPFVECMPYMSFFNRLASLCKVERLASFYTPGEHNKPIRLSEYVSVTIGICYDSVFGEYMAQSVETGSNLLAIMTNDGWWGNTAGYKQHSVYASLLAIANRRAVARAANTGISELINQRGEILKATAWDEQTVISGELKLNNDLTFYTRHKDYIPKIALSLLALVLAGRAITKKRQGAND